MSKRGVNLQQIWQAFKNFHFILRNVWQKMWFQQLFPFSDPFCLMQTFFWHNPRLLHLPQKPPPPPFLLFLFLPSFCLLSSPDVHFNQPQLSLRENLHILVLNFFFSFAFLFKKPNRFLVIFFCLAFFLSLIPPLTLPPVHFESSQFVKKRL